MRSYRFFIVTLGLIVSARADANADSRVIVVLRTRPTIQLFSGIPGESPHTRRIKNLQEANHAATISVLRSLNGKGLNLKAQDVRELWLVGGFATTATPEAILKLTNDPSVLKVIQNRAIRLPAPRRGETPQNEKYTYGLEKIGIPAAWAKYPNFTGGGKVAGVVDTGIDVTHPDLKGRLLAFHDFVNNKTESYDDQGHGTHVSGTIAGGNTSGTQIGVAPDAKLVVAKVFDSTGSGSTEILLAGMQWMADPDGNPDHVPVVVNNSWGGGGDADEKDPFYLAVDAWRKLDIFPSFAAGNEGPDSATISKPGAFPIAFAVCAVDENSEVASFSSVGPGQMTVGGTLQDFPKPDVCAPGVDVYSSLPGGKYASWSGTSMATPHVTGSVVLLRQKYPKKNIDQIAELLTQTATDLGNPGFDYQYGNGLIDVLKAMGRVRKSPAVDLVATVQ